MVTKISKDCENLLIQAQKYHWCYGNDLANHLPMGLIALDKLNATAKQMQHFYQKQIPKLNKRTASQLSLDSNWQKHLGDKAYFEAYLTYFKTELKQSSIKNVLQSHMNDLIQGVASYAFHALIHLAYAIESGLTSEIAHALAFWCSGFQTYAEVSDETNLNLNQILNEAKPVVADIDFAFGNITDRMALVCNMDSFKKLNTQAKYLTLDLIAELAINAFNRTRNFTLLHAVTATHALRIVLPFVENKTYMLRYFWHTIVIAYLTTINTKVLHKKENEPANWQHYLTQALDASNEHDIKITYSCYQEYKRSKDEIYLKSLSHLF